MSQLNLHLGMIYLACIAASSCVAFAAEPGESRATVSAGLADAPAVTGAARDLLGRATGFNWGSGIKALIVGGGSAHDFERWFNKADTATLTEGGKASVNYTDQPSAVLPALKDIDVLYLSNNQPLPDPALRRAVFDFLDAGKGLLLVHAGTWYNWKDWPEFNRQLVSGGSRGHDKYGEFEVTVTEPGHPVMAGVPARFKITDELYNFTNDEKGPPIQVLATGRSPMSGKTFPVVWITPHDKARIVCNTLGHDGRAHEHAAYKKILQNSLVWTARK
jgi:type 1 glutamine amidotransferase